MTQEELKQNLDYNPNTGEFYWKIKKPRIFPGKRAGYLDKKIGYRYIKIFRKNHCEHNLAWFYMTGYYPIRKIDHKDLIRSNNIFLNLRLCSHSQNMANTGLFKTNKTGLKGVHKESKCNRWNAMITHNYKKYYLGLFKTPQEAHEAYMKKAIEFFGEFARSK
jgi:hypothetical protein